MKKGKDLRPIIDFLKKDNQVKFAYLFGSQARGLTGTLSDTDIAVYLDKRVKPLQYRLRLMEGIAKVIKSDNLDLVVLNNAQPLIKHEIIKYGRLLKDDTPRRILFEVAVLREYLDTAHMRQMQRTTLADGIRKGTAYGP